MFREKDRVRGGERDWRVRLSTIDRVDPFIESHIEREARENVSDTKSEG